MFTVALIIASVAHSATTENASVAAGRFSNGRPGALPTRAVEDPDFKGLPLGAREKLHARLRLMAKHEAERNWGGVFDMLSPIYVQDETKEEYSKRRAEFSSETICKFVPSSVFWEFDNRWIVFGTVTMRESNQEHSSKASIEAIWEDGEFRFSDFLLK